MQLSFCVWMYVNWCLVSFVCVQEVRYAASHASVLLGSNEVLSGDAVLCTLPLGVLKRPKQGMGVEFVPPLPDWKTKAIDRLGFGLLNKVAIQFAEPFWDPETDFFGYTHDSENERYGWARLDLIPNVAQRRILLVLESEARERRGRANGIGVGRERVFN